MTMKLTTAQAAHLQRVKDAVGRDLDAKYRKGQIEHGGNLWQKPGMLDQAIAEVLDLAIYLYTMKEQHGLRDPATCWKCGEERLVETVKDVRATRQVCKVCGNHWSAP